MMNKRLKRFVSDGCMGVWVYAWMCGCMGCMGCKGVESGVGRGRVVMGKKLAISIVVVNRYTPLHTHTNIDILALTHTHTHPC